MNATSLLRRWVMRHPRLRRWLANRLYHFPALDLRLRRLLQRHSHASAALTAPPDRLTEPARALRDRWQAREPRP